MASRDCFTESELRRLIDSTLAGEEQRAFEKHIESCSRCRDLLDKLAGVVEVRFKKQDTRRRSAALTKVMADLRAITPSPTANDSSRSRFTFLSPATTPHRLGRLGKYEILSVLGEGGMGVVFAALDPVLNREVAIKVPAHALVSTREAHDRFMREARAIASVKHDNIVTVFDVDDHECTPYLVMELVDGPSLAERLENEGPVPWNEAARIGAEISAALAIAHTRGLVHRDIKPANILLDDSDGRAKLTDFGLARSSVDVSLTGTGVLAGTPEFMSPEQADGEDVTALSDLFSLGNFMHTACAGESPFRSDATPTTLHRVRNDDVKSLHEIDPTIPGWFSSIITQLMSKRPGERPQSATELIELFSEHQSEIPVFRQPTLESDKSARKTPRPSKKLMLATGLAIAGVIFAFFFRPGTIGNGSRSQSDFTVVGLAGSFPALGDAIAAAGDNEVIEVHGNGPFLVSGLQTRNKALTIRAAAGLQPVFLAATSQTFAEEPFLTAGADVRLEGLEVRWTVVAGEGFAIEDVARRSLLVIENGDLTLRNCRLVAGHMNCCLHVSHGSADLRNCHLIADAGPCCLWIPNHAARWRAENCVFQGRVGIMFDAAGAGGSSAVEFDFRENTFATHRAFHMVMGQPLRRFEFTTARNVFDASELLTLVPGKMFRARGLSAAETCRLITTVLQWIESHNAYRSKLQFLSRGTGPKSEVLVAALDDWKALWGHADSGSLETEFSNPQAANDSALPKPFAGIRWNRTSRQPIGADLRHVGPDPGSAD